MKSFAVDATEAEVKVRLFSFVFKGVLGISRWGLVYFHDIGILYMPDLRKKATLLSEMYVVHWQALTGQCITFLQYTDKCYNPATFFAR